MKKSVESAIIARRKRTAEEILDALEASGMSRKEFATKMGRQPSEVTKWLSGKHNFTSDLLAEISAVLSCPISGAEDRVLDSVHVAGYANKQNYSRLRETTCIMGGIELPSETTCTIGGIELPSKATCIIGGIELPSETTKALMIKAAESGESLREYIKRLLCEKASEKTVSAYDFNGIWANGGPDADEIYSLRSQNTIKEL